MTAIKPDADAQTSFSGMLRSATWTTHEDATGSPFLTSLLAGELDRGCLVDLVEQMWFVYSALEAAVARRRNDPVLAPFLSTALDRKAALEADLDALAGAAWRSGIHPTDATETYCRRIAEVAEGWPGGLLAHHYVRYMGDLSGGQFIGRRLEAVYAIADHHGTSFYVFDGIADPAAFKEGYRAHLDAAPLDSSEQQAIVEETLLAYRLNADLIDSLA